MAALSAHDNVTRGHSERVRAYSQMIAKELRLGREEVDRLNWAALLHDIGKLEVAGGDPQQAGAGRPTRSGGDPPSPGVGRALAEPLRAWLGDWTDAIADHHERWDGSGYPKGVEGDAISLAGRIVAVADVFDVITSARSYKEPGNAAAARDEIARCAGAQFDPRVVRAFLSISLGRLRLAMGPLSWLAQAPILGRIPLTPGVATLASSALAVVGSFAAGLVGTPHIPTSSPARLRPRRLRARPSGRVVAGATLPSPAPGRRGGMARGVAHRDPLTARSDPARPLSAAGAPAQPAPSDPQHPRSLRPPVPRRRSRQARTRPSARTPDRSGSPAGRARSDGADITFSVSDRCRRAFAQRTASRRSTRTAR